MRVDLRTGLVVHPDGSEARLEPKAAELLDYLVARADRPVGRDELLREVWQGKFVTDDVVTVSIYAIRQALGDQSRAPRFVETLHRRGYRWIAPVEPADAAASGEAANRQPPASRLPAALAALMLALVAGWLAWAAGTRQRTAHRATIARTAELTRAHARGMFYSERRGLEDAEKAVREFESALAIDSSFAETHAALAEAIVFRAEAGGDSSPASRQRARAEAEAALRLAPELAAVQEAVGTVAFAFDRDFERAEAALRHAIAIEPSLPQARRRLAYLLAVQGRFEEACAEARTAAEHSPASSSAQADLAWILLVSGQPEAAVTNFRAALELEPSNFAAQTSLAFALDLADRDDEAYASWRASLEQLDYDPEALAAFDEVYANGGLEAVYRAWRARLGSDPQPRVGYFTLAFFDALIGETERMFAELESSLATREAFSPWLGVHPAFAPYRRDPRFAELLRSLEASDS